MTMTKKDYELIGNIIGQQLRTHNAKELVAENNGNHDEALKQRHIQQGIWELVQRFEHRLNLDNGKFNSVQFEAVIDEQAEL